MTTRESRPLARIVCAFLLSASALVAARPATALETFDFETPYLVHPGQQVWDFCLVRDGGVVHAFYHTIPEQIGQPAYADTIWHATSTDLRRWTIVGPALTVGEEWYDAVAMWAPDVVRDEASGRWAMLYTGVAGPMVQRACLAWSDDLLHWTKSPANPVFEPDSLVYHWAPNQSWSSFRDPFVHREGQQWVMLSTAGLRLGGYPGYRRGIIHRAVSADLENWQDGGVFYEHDGAVGRTRDLESPQYLVRDGWHHLFFVEQDLDLDSHPTSHMVAAGPEGWTMAERAYVDNGWAPEIEAPEVGAEASPHVELFARLAKGKNPVDGTWFVTARFDSVAFDPATGAATIMPVDPLGGDWPVRVGDIAATVPTFGDNPAWRAGPPSGLEGHGWISTGECYGGPLSGVGTPGLAMPHDATGRIESRPFTLTGGILRLLLDGGYYPETCYVALLADADGAELSRVSPGGPHSLHERLWDVGAFTGMDVRLAVVDDETGWNGWIAVDGIEERTGSLAAAPDAGDAVLALGVQPNPCNGGAALRFVAARDGVHDAAVYDLAGRRVWDARFVAAAGQDVSLAWEARDHAGRALPSGVYFARVVADGRTVARARVTLVK